MKYNIKNNSKLINLDCNGYVELGSKNEIKSGWPTIKVYRKKRNIAMNISLVHGLLYNLPMLKSASY